MSATKSRRWTCPTCASGVLAPSKPRRDDVRRYCLDCSKRSGRLVERTCPSIERERAARTASSAAQAKARRASATSKRQAAAAAQRAKLDRRFMRKHPVTGETVDLRDEVAKVWRAARRVEPRLRATPPRLVASRGYGSYAYTHCGEIHLGAGADYHTLVHEVSHFVHLVDEPRRFANGKRAVHDRSFYYALKAVTERLVPGLTVSFYGVTKWGYNVDVVIAHQVRAHAGEAVAS